MFDIFLNTPIIVKVLIPLKAKRNFLEGTKRENDKI